jgi:hypothetical protein
VAEIGRGTVFLVGLGVVVDEFVLIDTENETVVALLWADYARGMGDSPSSATRSVVKVG